MNRRAMSPESREPGGGETHAKIAERQRRNQAVKRARGGDDPEAQRGRQRAPASPDEEDHRARVGTFCRRHAEALVDTVARRVHAPRATIEDACQLAWIALMRRHDIVLDRGGLAWLRVVATREAWRLASAARELPAGAFQSRPAGEALEDGVQPEPAAESPSPEEQAIAAENRRERIADLQVLKPAERRDLYLQALGYSYAEAAAMTGQTRTAVNRHLSDGRAHLRHLAVERDQPRAA